MMGELGGNTHDNERHSRNTSALADNIEQITFKIRNTGGHFSFKTFHRNNFNPDINPVTNKKRHVLNKQVMSNK